MSATVQRGTVTIAASTLSITAIRGTSAGFDTTVDTAKTLLTFTSRCATDNAGMNNALGVLTDGDTITFTRGIVHTNPVIIEWQLVTVPTDFLVLRGTGVITGGATEATNTIAAASLGASRFIVATGSESATNPSPTGAGVVRLDLSDTVTIRGRTLVADAGATITYGWQVVEWVGATVQVAERTGTTGAAADLDFPTLSPAIDEATSVVFATSGTSSVATYGAFHLLFTSTTNLRLTRGRSNTVDLDVTAYIVTHPFLFVQRITFPVTAGAGLTATTAVGTAVTVARTMLVDSQNFQSYNCGFGSNTIAQMPAYNCTLALQNTTDVLLTLSATSGNATYVAQIAEIVVGPTIDTQPEADVVLINGDPTRASASYTVAATTSGGSLSYDWELEETVGGGTYVNVPNGAGLTWSGADTATLTAVVTAKTQTGKRVRCNVTDENGTTTTDAVLLTIYTGPVLSKSSGTTNGSGVDTLTITSDYPNGEGEFTVTTATSRGITETVSQVFTA